MCGGVCESPGGGSCLLRILGISVRNVQCCGTLAFLGMEFLFCTPDRVTERETKAQKKTQS